MGYFVADNDVFKMCEVCGDIQLAEDITNGQCDSCGGKMRRVYQCNLCFANVFSSDCKEHTKRHEDEYLASKKRNGEN